MKKILFPLFLLVLGVWESQAASVLSFEVSYALTANYAASTNVGAVPNQAKGIWLGNLRDQGTFRDQIIANQADNTVSVRLCLDNGAFGTLANYPVSLGPTAVRSADFTGDGAEEIVVANSGTNTVSVLLNGGSGSSFGAATHYVVGSTPVSSPVSLAIGDANSDGIGDIITANAAEDTVSVLTNFGGVFTLMTNIAVGNNPQSVQLLDLNGDSLKDLLVANRDEGSLTILTNQVGGFFNWQQTITNFPGGDPQIVQALTADFDNNGFMDIVAANYASNTVSILLGASGGIYTLTTNIVVGTGPRSMVLRDLNADGDMDVAVANEGSGNISVILSYGDGTFDANNTFGAGSGPAAIAGSNFNGDGLNDLAVANNTDNTVSILIYDLPVAYTGSKTVLEDSTNNIVLQSAVLSGRTATYTVLFPPLNGDLTGSGATRTYAPDPDFYGTDSFTFFVNDGTHSSEVATVNLTVTSVNDRPTVSLAINAVTLENYGVVNTYPGVIDVTSVGPANESGQTTTFLVTTTNANQFISKPVIDPAGTLTFKPSAIASGTVYVTVQARDSGGIFFGGTNLSLPEVLSITLPANPYPAIKGTYRGLFYESAAVEHESSGYYQMTLGSYGEFTGKIISGGHYTFKGRLNVAGVAQTNIARGVLPALTLSITNDLAPGGTEQTLGTITDGLWMADLQADRATFHAVTNIAPQAGSYTLLCPGTNNPAAGPAGESFARVSVSDAGVVKTSGVLADGRTFTQLSALSKNGQWPLYASLYSHRGSVLSWITFVDQFDTSFTGNLSWIKTGTAGGNPYLAGFTNDLVASGSTYTVPNIGERTIAVTNGLTFLDGGNLAVPLVNSVILDVNNQVLVSTGEATNMVVTISTNGLVTGRFKHPANGRTTSLKGIVFQQQNTIGGFFLGTNQGGVFLLEKND